MFIFKIEPTPYQFSPFSAYFPKHLPGTRQHSKFRLGTEWTPKPKGPQCSTETICRKISKTGWSNGRMCCELRVTKGVHFHGGIQQSRMGEWHLPVQEQESGVQRDQKYINGPLGIAGIQEGVNPAWRARFVPHKLHAQSSATQSHMLLCCSLNTPSQFIQFSSL